MVALTKQQTPPWSAPDRPTRGGQRQEGDEGADDDDARERSPVTLPDRLHTVPDPVRREHDHGQEPPPPLAAYETGPRGE